MVLAAMFLALGYILPFFTGQIKVIGKMLLPMHLPVLLCGLVCGWKWGLVVGFVLPLTRSFFFSMPQFYPSAVGMAFELAAYGFFVGFLFWRMKRRHMGTLYLSLIISMILGRAVWGIAQTCLRMFTSSPFSLALFVAGGVVEAIPGMILQLILVPLVMLTLDRTGFLPFHIRSAAETGSGNGLS